MIESLLTGMGLPCTESGGDRCRARVALGQEALSDLFEAVATYLEMTAARSR